MTAAPDTELESAAAEATDDAAAITAVEQRARTSGANRNLAFILVGGAVAMLATAFAVALLVTHGG